MASKLSHSHSELSISSLQLKENISSESSSYNMYESLLQDFYGFNHSNTKWILATLSSSLSLKRLKSSKGKYNYLLQSYFEIPDNPAQYPSLRSEDFKLNAPAFHSLVSLYLNPLGISIYTRNEAALRFLLDLKLNSFSDPCFVQRLWNKGEDEYLTDFTAVHIVSVAIRRNFFESITLMIHAGFNPRERIYQVDHIQSCDKSKTHVFQDCLDQALGIMDDRPCLDIGLLFKTITNMKLENRYDPIVFEMHTVFSTKNGIQEKHSRIRSLFRLVIHQAKLNRNGRFSSNYLGILEIIQKQGYFRYLSKELCHLKPLQSFLDSKHACFCESNFLQSNETEIKRLYRSDIVKLSPEKRVQCLILDRNICIGIMFLWCRDINKKGRQHQKCRLTKLVVDILLDSDLIVWFLKSSDDTVVKAFTLTCCGVDPINTEDISIIRITVIEFLRYRDSLKKRIMIDHDKILNNLFKKVEKPQIKSTKSLHQQNKTSPYLLVNSRAIQSWNMKKKTKVNDKDLTMVSIQQKMGKMIRSNLNRGCTEFSATSKHAESGDISIRMAPNYCYTNSLDSIDEQNSFDSGSMTVLNPPPLIIRKSTLQSLAPSEAAKEHIEATFQVNDMSQLGKKCLGNDK